MRVAAAEAEHHHVAGLRLVDLAAAIEDKAEIAFLAAVQVPVGRIGPRIERRTKPVSTKTRTSSMPQSTPAPLMSAQL